MKYKMFLVVFLLLILCGCSPYSVESLFVPPALPEEYAQLNSLLNEVRASGADYAYPASGTNRQAVQMFDLDTDGEDECVAFFRNADQMDDVQIHLYECTDGKYWLYAVVDGKSSAIDQVEYADVLGRGNYELIVGWERGSSKTLSVYEMTEETFAQHYEMPYQYYIVSDLSGDGVSDLNIIDSEPGAPAKLVMHTAQSGNLAPSAQASLSVNGAAVGRIGIGETGGISAIFVTSEYQDGYVTDVIGVHERVLKNLAAAAPLYCKYPIYFSDLDGDGEIEVPRSEYDPLRPESALWELVWCGYGEDGNLNEKLYTYHCSEQNWYLRLPLAWKGHVEAEYDSSNAAITKAIFYTKDYTPLFTFAAISGEKRMELLEREGMEQIAEQSNTIYAAKIDQESYLNEVLTPEWVSEAFRRRENTWTAANLILN